MPAPAGYWSDNNFNACADQGIDAYIATGRLPHGQKLPPKRCQLPRDANTKTRMARKLRSKKGSKIYWAITKASNTLIGRWPPAGDPGQRAGRWHRGRRSRPDRQPPGRRGSPQIGLGHGRGSAGRPWRPPFPELRSSSSPSSWLFGAIPKGSRSLLRIDQLPASPQTPTNLPRSQ
jgi:hypothetical protein